jgi:hypothetical protein
LDKLVAGVLMHLFARPELRVGVVGHRLNQLPEAIRPSLQETIGRLFAVIELVGAEAGAGRFTLLSALAEGTDRYAANAALARGWALESPLPFSVKRYEKDFSERASKLEFRALMKKARKVSPHPQNDGDDDAGYGGVGARIASHCHVLLAVWNGAAAKGPGGTAHVIALALGAGAPVLWLSLSSRTPTRLLPPAKKAARRGDLDKDLRRGLLERFAVVEAPDELTVDV